MSFSNGGNIVWAGTRSKGYKEKLITNEIRDASKQANQMLASSHEERDLILREHGRKICDEYLSKNTISPGKSRHIPFSYGQGRFAIELFNLTGIETSSEYEDGYNKLSPEDRARYDKSTITVGESIYFFGIKPDKRRK